MTLQGDAVCLGSGQTVALGTETDTTSGKPTLLQEVNLETRFSSDATSKEIPKSVRNVALSLVLREIAHEARFSTMATGCAVLLLEDGVPVQSASSGVVAREASDCLNRCSAGKSGVRTICQDTEMDSRFDSAFLGRLGVRSFVILPVRSESNAVVAILQIVCSRPGAFIERDCLGLQGLGHRIADHIEVADRIFISSADVTAASSKTTVPAQSVVVQNKRWHYRLFLGFADGGWNFALGIVTILLAILLGWMIGRGERQTAMRMRVSSVKPALSQSQTTFMPQSPRGAVAIQQTVPDTNTAAASTSSKDPHITKAPRIRDSSLTQIESNKSHPDSKRSAIEVITSGAPSDDVVIFDNGKRKPLSPYGSTAVNELQRNTPGEQSTSEDEDHQPMVRISEAVAEQHLLERVEPDYPDSVRANHLQGTVILNIYVGKNGAVRSLSCVTGDSQLCLLAAKAVRQWKFSPLIHDGAPASFESQATIEFALPSAFINGERDLLRA